MDLTQVIRNIPDFPKPGIQFKDITTLLADPEAFQWIINTWTERYRAMAVEGIVAIDARGFVFGGALAFSLGIPLILARKKGKLPGEILAESFALEYGTDTIEMHSDTEMRGQRVVVMDDLLATGGTAAAATRLVRRLGGEVVEAAFVVELPPLGGRAALANIPVHSLVSFMVD